MAKLSVDFILGEPFQPSLLFASKARSLLKRGLLLRCSGRPSLIIKHKIGLEKLSRNIRSSLFGLVFSDENEVFIKLTTGVNFVRLFLRRY